MRVAPTSPVRHSLASDGKALPASVRSSSLARSFAQIAAWPSHHYYHGRLTRCSNRRRCNRHRGGNIYSSRQEKQKNRRVYRRECVTEARDRFRSLHFVSRLLLRWLNSVYRWESVTDRSGQLLLDPRLPTATAPPRRRRSRNHHGPPSTPLVGRPLAPPAD